MDKFVTGAPRRRRPSELQYSDPLAGSRLQSKRCEAQASLSELSEEFGIHPKTVAKWRNRATVEHLQTGPREPRSTVLADEEEAMIVAFRRHTLLRRMTVSMLFRPRSHI